VSDSRRRRSPDPVDDGLSARPDEAGMTRRRSGRRREGGNRCVVTEFDQRVRTTACLQTQNCCSTVKSVTAYGPKGCVAQTPGEHCNGGGTVLGGGRNMEFGKHSTTDRGVRLAFIGERTTNKCALRSGFALTAAFCVLLVTSAPARAATQTLSGSMTGAQAVPSNSSAATGTCTVALDEASDVVTFSGTFTGLGAQAFSASIHGLAGPGVLAPVLVSQNAITSGTSGTFSGSAALTPFLTAGMAAGQTYCEIDDAAFPGGEIRAALIPQGPPVPALPTRAIGALALILSIFAMASLRARSALMGSG
jgi:CHRD domain